MWLCLWGAFLKWDSAAYGKKFGKFERTFFVTTVCELMLYSHQQNALLRTPEDKPFLHWQLCQIQTGTSKPFSWEATGLSQTDPGQTIHDKPKRKSSSNHWQHLSASFRLPVPILSFFQVRQLVSMPCLTAVFPACTPSLLLLPCPKTCFVTTFRTLFSFYICWLPQMVLILLIKTGDTGSEGDNNRNNINRSNFHPTHFKLWEPKSKAVVKGLSHLYWQTRLS